MVKINGAVPECGDIIKLQFNTQSGCEQANYRPVIIISPADYNRISTLILVCPITRRKKRWPFEVELTGQMQTNGVVLVDPVKSLDCGSRNATFIEKAPSDVIDEVLARLNPLVS